MKALKVDLPDPVHSHWSEVRGCFVTHAHPHAGAHQHTLVAGRPVVQNKPGNYSPKEAR